MPLQQVSSTHGRFSRCFCTNRSTITRALTTSASSGNLTNSATDDRKPTLTASSAGTSAPETLHLFAASTSVNGRSDLHPTSTHQPHPLPQSVDAAGSLAGLNTRRLIPLLLHTQLHHTISDNVGIVKPRQQRPPDDRTPTLTGILLNGNLSSGDTSASIPATPSAMLPLMGAGPSPTSTCHQPHHSFTARVANAAETCYCPSTAS